MPKSRHVKERSVPNSPDVIHLCERDCITNEEADKLAGEFLDEQHYSILVGEKSADVYKPNGEPLVIFRKKILPPETCSYAYAALRKAANPAGNRGMAAGIVKEDEMRIANRPTVKKGGAKVRMSPVKKDGKISNTSYGKAVPSGIIGFFDRNARFPFCRMTAFNMNHAAKFAMAMPLIRAIDKVFKQECPQRHAAQMSRIERTSPDFVIPGTSFTTVTVNRNFRTACHKDAGDLKEGFGVMTAMRAGHYTGGYLIFPKYRVAVDMGTCDLLLADVHEWHGNSPIIGVEGAFERLSLVLYYREMMIKCLSAAEELERAKTRKKGDKIND